MDKEKINLNLKKKQRIKMVSYSLSDEYKAKCRAIAKKLSISQTQLIRDLIDTAYEQVIK